MYMLISEKNNTALKDFIPEKKVYNNPLVGSLGLMSGVQVFTHKNKDDKTAEFFETHQELYRRIKQLDESE